MPSYITAAQLRLVLPDAVATDDPALDALIARASAIVDGYCARTWEAQTASEARTFYGNGLPRLPIDWTDDTVSAVSLPSGYTAPTFVEQRRVSSGSLYLQITDASGFVVPATCDYLPYIWRESMPITIEAAWGYESFPGDVVEVTSILATARWRETYAAGLADWQGDVGRDYQIPPNALAILDRLRMASTFTVGGGF